MSQQKARRADSKTPDTNDFLSITFEGEEVSLKTATRVAQILHGAEGQEKIDQTRFAMYQLLNDKCTESDAQRIDDAINGLSEVERFITNDDGIGIYDYLRLFTRSNVIKVEGKGPQTRFVPHPNAIAAGGIIRTKAQALASAATARLPEIARIAKGKPKPSGRKNSNKPRSRRRRPENKVNKQLLQRIEAAIDDLPNVKRLVPGNGERGLYPMLKGLVSARVLDEDRSGKSRKQRYRSPG